MGEEGKEETAREIAVKVIPDTVIYVADLRLKAEPVIFAALRQRADEATEECATFLEDEAQREGDDHSAFTLRQAAAAIRARIRPKGQL